MTYSEAMDHADTINERCDNLRGIVVRTLPSDIDPPDPSDNGWDVEVTVYS